MFVGTYSNHTFAYAGSDRTPQKYADVFACMVAGAQVQIQVQEQQQQEQRVHPARLPLRLGEGRRD